MLHKGAGEDWRKGHLGQDLKAVLRVLVSKEEGLEREILEG